jgi:hypothetical protein
LACGSAGSTFVISEGNACVLPPHPQSEPEPKLRATPWHELFVFAAICSLDWAELDFLTRLQLCRRFHLHIRL